MSVRFHPLWLIVLANLMLAAGYSFVTPLLETPDEPAHYYYVREIARGRGLPVRSADANNPLAQEGHQPPAYYLLGGLATAWIDASDYESIVKRNPYAAFDEMRPDNRNIFMHGRRELQDWRGAVLGMHVARLVSALCGALAVIGTYLLARELFSSRMDWAVGGAAFVAFLPQYNFIAGAVSNDSLVTAMCAMSFAWLARVWRDGRIIQAVLLGVWLGLAALAKPSGMLILPLVFGALGLDALRRRDRLRWKQIGVVLTALVVVGGWWFARNALLYGDWFGLNTHLDISGLRERPLSLEDFWEQRTEIEISFWGLFGWGNIPLPQIMYDVLHGFAVLAMFSLVIYVLWRGWRSGDAAAIGGLIVWVGIVFALFYRWNTLVVAPHGRLLFPALCAIALLLVIGATWFVPERWRMTWVAVGAGALFFVSAWALTQTLPAAYPRPSIVSESSLPANSLPAPVHMGGEIQLGAIELPARALRPDESFNVVLYWQALKPLDKDYTVTLQMFAPDGKRIVHHDTFPLRGMYPTSQWLAGEWLRDDYPLRVSADAPAGAATLIVGMYDRLTNRALQIDLPDGRRVGRVTLGQIEVR